MDFNTQHREAIEKGSKVAIATDKNNEKLTEGIVKEIITPEDIDYVKDGVEVRITNGMIGFVKKILEPTVLNEDNLLKLIKNGETSTIEFKQTFQVDAKKQKKLECLRDATVKAIASFMNTKGGILFIGIDDSKKNYRLENGL